MEAQLGMQERPFDSGIAQDADVFLGRRLEAVIGRFKVAVASPDAVVTFTGPAGVGKTTLALAAVRATSTRLATAWLSAVPTNATELLELLLVELGMNAHRTTRIERLQMWRQYLSELGATESRVFVIAERTEDLPPEVLRALDSLTAADANGCPGANVVLLGRPGLDQFLATPGLDSLRQRIRLRHRLEAFQAAELTQYLRHRVTRAGGDFDKTFAAGAAEAVHRYSGGIARVANSLCETALGVAAAEGRAQITAELIAEVAADMLGIAEPAQSADGATAAKPGPEAREPKAPPVEVVAPPSAPAAAPMAISPAPPEPLETPTPARTAPPAPVAPAVAPPAAVVKPPAAAISPPPAPVPPPPAAVASAPAPRARPTAPPVATAAPVAEPAPAPAAARPRPPVPPVVKRTEPVPPPSSAAAFVPFEAFKPAGPDFDATATDVPDISSLDFPVLTDAVDEPAPTPRQARPTAPSPPPQAAAKPPRPPAPAATRPPAARPAAPAPKPAPPAAPLPAAADAPPKPAAPAPPPPKAAEPKPPAQGPAIAPAMDGDADGDADLLRQTQTMRALSVAKSIDDVSDSMAETLFGDADLDALSAALASAGFNADADESPAAEPSPPPAAESDDIMDLFNLGPDAPLELIDDSVTPRPNQSRKSATRR
jgi:type II secretory pathway predicted ATPase ExeA